MQIFLSAFDDIPDPRAGNARHDLCELLVVAFVAVLCGATSCADMAAFGRAKERVFRDFLKLRYAIPSHDTFSAVFKPVSGSGNRPDDRSEGAGCGLRAGAGRDRGPARPHSATATAMSSPLTARHCAARATRGRVHGPG